MPLAIYIDPDGVQTEVDVPIGQNLMRGANDQGVYGLPGDCGGTLACATCHVFVEDVFLPLLSPMSSSEDQMLEYTATERGANSRLSCQLTMTQHLDGIRLRIAERQV